MGGLREHSFTIDEAFVRGLQPDAWTKRNAPYLVEMKNLKPTIHGGLVPEAVTYPISNPSLSMDWPFPQLLRGQSRTLLAGKTTMYNVSEDTWDTEQVTTYSAHSPTSQLSITAGGPWHMASFQFVRFLTNGQSLVFYAPSNYGERVLVADSLRVNTVTRHNNRLFLGGLYGSWLDSDPWQDLISVWQETLPEDHFVSEGVRPYYLPGTSGDYSGARWLAWSEPGGGASDIPFHLFLSAMGVWGSAALDNVEELAVSAIEQGKIGFMPITTPGAILCIKPLGDRMVVYGSRGISVLHPDGDRYREQVLTSVGIAGRGAVGGTDTEHLFIDSIGDAWRLLASGVPEHIKRREYFSAMTGADIVVTYDPGERDYWVSDGSVCYVITPSGVGGPTTIKPSSLLRAGNGALCGTAIGIGDSLDIQVETCDFDIAERGTKHIVGLQVPLKGLTNVKAQTRYKYDVTDDWMGSPWKPISRKGAGFQNISFVDGRVRIKGDVAAANARVERIEVRYSGEDRSARRGTKGIPEAA